MAPRRTSAHDAIALLHASSLIPPRNVISSLLNGVSEIDSETYLFLDDFHVVSDHRCHELMALLLRYAPSNLHLVLVSRTEPRLPLSRLRLDDQLAEIDAALLKFTLAETAELLGPELAQRLGNRGVAKLHRATEGWPAALQLARISLVNSADPVAHIGTISGTTRNISELFEDTLATEPPAVVDFLLKTSILDQMNGALCSTVAGTAEGPALLDALERAQFMLVPLDENGNWYRYHHLLREFLADRLRIKLSDQIPDLYRKAYNWYAAREQWSEAVHYAIAAGDFPIAIEFIENCAMSMVVKGRPADVAQLGAAPAEGADELAARGQVGARLGNEPRHPLQGSRRLAGAGRGRNRRNRRQATYGGAAARRVRFTTRCVDDGARGRDLALECLAGHRFDAFNFNALCNVARYAYLKAGDWNAFYAVLQA